VEIPQPALAESLKKGKELQVTSPLNFGLYKHAIKFTREEHIDTI
jgi:hypothetical protein